MSALPGCCSTCRIVEQQLIQWSIETSVYGMKAWQALSLCL
jgi:hypothetical protein